MELSEIMEMSYNIEEYVAGGYHLGQPNTRGSQVGKIEQLFDYPHQSIHIQQWKVITRNNFHGDLFCWFKKCLLWGFWVPGPTLDAGASSLKKPGKAPALKEFIILCLETKKKKKEKEK